MSKESAEEAVKRGIVWLDGIRPNWRELLDWDLLDMESNTRCILGQVFAEDAKSFPGGDICASGYRYAEEIFRINSVWLGFDSCNFPSLNGEKYYPNHTHDQLESAWRKLS